jgi:predicted RNase H-like nuclease (RuvC/YqgF family)
MKPLIVGIDPGTTSAFAVLDFDFNLISIESKRNFLLSEMICSIFYLGDPIIVATDKKEIPSFVHDFSRKLGAKAIPPKHDMKKGEKKRIVKQSNFQKFTNNVHETDALASAIYAYKEYFPLIKKINYILKKHKKQKIKNKVISIVVLDEISIKKAIDLIEKKKDKTIKKIKKAKKKQLTPKKQLTNEQKQILLLKTQNLKLEQNIIELEKELKKQKNKKIDIDKETKKLLSFKEKRILFFETKIKEKNLEIKRLNKELKKLKTLIPLINKSVLIKKLDNLSKEEYNNKNQSIEIKQKDILYVKDLSVYSESVIEKLENKKIKIIIYTKKTNKLLIKKFILVSEGKLNLRQTKVYAFVDKNEFDSVIKKEIKKKRYEKDLLKNIVEEYKRERIIK